MPHAHARIDPQWLWARSGVMRGDGRTDCALWPSGAEGAGDSQHEIPKRTEAPEKRTNDPQRGCLGLRQLIVWHSIPEGSTQVAFMSETQKWVLHRLTKLPLELWYAERPARVSGEEYSELVYELVSARCFCHNTTPNLAETIPDEFA